MKKIAIVIALLILIGVATYPTILSLKNEYYGSSSNDDEKYNDNNFNNIIDSELETSDKDDDKEKDSEKQKEEKDKEKEEDNGSEDNTSTSASGSNSSTGSLNQNNNSSNQSSGSSSSGNSNNNNSNNSNNTQSTPNPTPTPEPTPSVPTYAKLVLMDSEGDEITVVQSGNNFSLSGSMKEKDLISGLSSGSYLRLKIVAPKLYSISELNNMSVTLLYSGKTYTQASNNILEVVSDSAYAYFYLTQEFMYGQEISIVVDWGDGNPITYTFTFNVNVIKKTE